MLNEKEKEKLEELEKEIYKKDLFIRNNLLEMNDLKNQIDNLNLDKIEIEKELNNYKQLLEEKNKEIAQLRNNNIHPENINNIIININNINITQLNPNPNFEILNSDYYVSHKDYSYQIDMPKEYLEGFVKLGTKEFNFIFWIKMTESKFGARILY